MPRLLVLSSGLLYPPALTNQEARLHLHLLCVFVYLCRRQLAVCLSRVAGMSLTRVIPVQAANFYMRGACVSLRHFADWKLNTRRKKTVILILHSSNMVLLF